MKSLKNFSWIVLINIFLVVIAGSVVRMTGSGMGCPDWPKCFGYLVPPTSESQLIWEEGKEFEKSQMIIKDSSLWESKSSFITGDSYDENNWKKYTKHDYANFNPTHTWIEYINRLFGALAGLATLVLAVLSIGYWKRNKKITVLSWLVVLAMGFQAWLGATVVYSVLNPFKITIHMVMALVIVAMLLYLIAISKTKIRLFKYDRTTLVLFIIALIFTLIQVILGTQVREFVDVQIDLVGESAKHLWLQGPTIQFYYHRSFSIIVTLLNLFIAYRIYQLGSGHSKINWVLLLILFEIITGMAMYYLSFPFATQPVHLILASLLFGVQFYLVLEVLKSKRSHKTL